jgi:predicted acetyltransferase
MSAGLQYLSPIDDLEAYAQLRAMAFGGPHSVAREVIERHPTDTRGLCLSGQLVAGLHLVPMGQFFGGRRVSMTGIAAVAVASHARGRGVATELMRRALGELAEQEVAVSTLYPATYGLYQRVGYARAGGHFRITVPVRAIGVRARELDMQPLSSSLENQRLLAEMYTTYARHRDGWLDRSPYIWHRLHTGPGQGEAQCHMVLDAGSPAGYILCRQEPTTAQHGNFDLWIEDMIALTEPACRRLLGFLSEHQTVAANAVWHGALDDSFVQLLPERGAEIALADPWMLRIVDVKRALSERGYPSQVSTRLELRIVDDLLPRNHGRFVLELSAGQAQVRAGGRGNIELPIASLASLFTGFTSPRQLAALDRISATARSLDRLDSVFPARNPCLPDFF